MVVFMVRACPDPVVFNSHDWDHDVITVTPENRRTHGSQGVATGGSPLEIELVVRRAPEQQVWSFRTGRKSPCRGPVGKHKSGDARAVHPGQQG